MNRKLLPLGILLLTTFVSCLQTQKEIKGAITTIYPTKDRVISNFVVTDPAFGAKAEPGFGNRAAFQSAIDAAYNNGGTVESWWKDPQAANALRTTYTSIELTNNYYESGVRNNSEKPSGITGSDVAP